MKKIITIILLFLCAYSQAQLKTIKVQGSGSSGGASKYTTNGYGSIVDSTSSLYTIKADTNVTAKLRDAKLNALTDTATAIRSQVNTNTGNIATNAASILTKWGITGNSAINRTIQFIGTTDNTPVPIRINNIIVAAWDTANKQTLGIGNKMNTYFGPAFYSKLRIFDTAFILNGDYNTNLTIVPEYAITSGNFTGGAIGGMQSEVRINGANTGNFNSYYPVYSYRGSRNVQSGATGTINKAVSYHAVSDVSAMTTSLSAGFFAENPFVQGTGVITNNVGLYIQAMTAGTNNHGIMDSAYGNLFIGGVLPNGTNLMKMTATMPTTITATTNAIDINITGSGSSSQANRAMNVLYSAGYTGSSSNGAIVGVNSNAGTGVFTITGGAGNYGIQTLANATTTGTNLNMTYALGGNLNIGHYARANGVKNSAVNIGTLGHARNSATGGIGIAGYFTQDTAALSTGTATTVYINNGNQSNALITIQDNGTSVATMSDGGNLFLGGTTATATAKLHIGASTATASSGQIKLVEGTRQTTAEDGTINYIANNLEFVEGTIVYTLAKTITATATLDFTSTAASTSTDLTITVIGAADGDAVSIGVPNGAINANSCFTAFVSATNTVTVRFNNYQTVGAIDPASASFRASVTKY